MLEIIIDIYSALWYFCECVLALDLAGGNTTMSTCGLCQRCAIQKILCHGWSGVRNMYAYADWFWKHCVSHLVSIYSPQKYTNK